MWPEMSLYVGRIRSLERLYVSIQRSASRDLEGRIVTTIPFARICRLPNRGRDVLAFLQWLGVAPQQRIEVVCKIHTKRSPHLPQGDAWRRDMLDKLLGSERVMRDIVASFRALSLGIVGRGHLVPWSFYRERNTRPRGGALPRIGFNVKRVGFQYVAR